MKNTPLVYGLIGGLIGAGLMWIISVSVVNSRDVGLMTKMGYTSTAAGEEIVFPTDQDMGMGMSMNEMTATLVGKTGDEFDMAFIEAMIAHHQGAIEMAKLARESAKHKEIRNLAEEIIKAQTKEIEQMQMWQKTWGY